MELTSTAFVQGGDIGRRYSCEGEDIAPPLGWRDIPPGTKTLALIVDDPDAPDPAAPTMTWVHWILFDIPPDATGLPDGGKPLPAGTREGVNDWNRTRYGGPCPPVGRHRYFFKLYALDTALPDLQRPTKTTLEHAMRGHVLDRSELVATYQRHRG